jgi:hypothetical protein
MSNDDELKGQSSVAGTPVLTKRNGIISRSLCNLYIVQWKMISADHEKFTVFQVAYF